MRARPAPVPFLWLALLAYWAIFVVVSLVLCGRGFLHPESYSFLPHFLSGRPLLELIYANQITDWGHYQARELSFVFDYLDCQFIDWCWRHGHPHFFSLSHYGLLLVAGIALWRIASHHLGLSDHVSICIVCLVWSSPSAMLYTSFYRSAKVGLFTMTLLTTWAWLAARARTGPQTSWRVGLFGLAALMLPMFDKQGLIFLCGLLLFMIRNAIVLRTQRDRHLAVVSVVALVLAVIYARFIGPAVVHRLHGYAIERDYAAIPWQALLSDPGATARIAVNALVLTVDSFRIPLGNLPLGIALLAGWWIVCQASGSGRDRLPGWQRLLEPGSLFPGLVALVGATYAAMLTLFPLMASSEHRRFFYCLPVTALWVLALAFAFAVFQRRNPDRQHWLLIATGSLLLSNLFALQEHRFVLRHGHYREFCENAARVQFTLVPAHITDSGVPPERAAELFEAAPLFPDAVPPSLEQDRIFLFFLSRYEALQLRSE